MNDKGLTLVEVLVALVVLEVGLLAVVGTLVLAARLLTRATLLERGAAEVSWTLDSLAASGWGGGGTREAPGGAVAWRRETDSVVWVEFLAEGEVPPLRVWTRVTEGDPPS